MRIKKEDHTGKVDESCFLAKQPTDRYGINWFELLQLMLYMSVLCKKGIIQSNEILFEKLEGMDMVR